MSRKNLVVQKQSTESQKTKIQKGTGFTVDGKK
jgi:hypothetical protein